MKYLSIVLIAVIGLMMPQQAQAQNDAISKYFDKYMDDESFTVVYISSKMFEMFARLDPDVDEEVKGIINDLKGLRILVKENADKSLYKEAIKKINFDEYEELMTVRSEGENIKFVIKEQGDVIKELLLIVGGGDSFVLMSFVGIIDLEKISKLSKNVNINIDGLEKLEELDKLEKLEDNKDNEDEDEDDDEDEN